MQARGGTSGNRRAPWEYMTATSMLASVLCHVPGLRDVCFLRRKWQLEKQGEAQSGDPHLLHHQILKLVHGIMRDTDSRAEVTRNAAVLRNIEANIPGPDLGVELEHPQKVQYDSCYVQNAALGLSLHNYINDPVYGVFC